MIISRVEGGLGNQMFIYAMGLALSLRSQQSLMLDISNSNYESGDRFGRTFRLDQFCLRATIADPTLVGQYSRSSRYFYWRRKLSNYLPISRRPIIEEPRVNPLHRHSISPQGTTYVIGYWQDEAFFADCQENIYLDFTYKKPFSETTQALANLTHSERTAFIHVRRRDYPFRLTINYYRAAITKLQREYQVTKFFVFGDDPAWTQQHLFPLGNMQFLDQANSRSEHEDLWLMAQFRFGIIANSSFSWWAAWLAAKRYPDALMICPSTWGYLTNPSRRFQQLASQFEPA